MRVVEGNDVRKKSVSIVRKVSNDDEMQDFIAEDDDEDIDWKRELRKMTKYNPSKKAKTNSNE